MIDQIKSTFRLWFARVWKVRGGGLYAVGWAATFLYLEITTVLGEIVDADGVIDFITSQLIEFVFRFLGESLVNMIQAFMWPVFFVQWNPPVGAVALGAAFFLFPIFVKPHITKWLFPGGEPDSETDETSR